MDTNSEQSHPAEANQRSIGIRELRSRLADTIRRASRGERMVVTSAGQPVAQIGPLDEHAPALERLIAAGAIVAPRRSGTFRPPAPINIWSGVRIDQALRELRG